MPYEPERMKFAWREIKPIGEKDPPREGGISRRGILAGMAGGAVGAGAYFLFDSRKRAARLAQLALDHHFEPSGERFSGEQTPFGERVRELRERYAHSPANYVFLIGADGQPTGDPVWLFDLTVNGRKVSPGIDTYRLTTSDAVNEEWLAEAYRRRGLARPPQGAPRCEIRRMTLLEYVRHYGESPERGVAYGIGRRSPLRYVREHIYSAADEVPEWMRRQLPSVVPALIGIESGFNNSARSRSNARGAVQYMPQPWNTLQQRLGVSWSGENLPDQLQFVGAYFNDIYQSYRTCMDLAAHPNRPSPRNARSAEQIRFARSIGIAFANITRLVFRGNEQRFERYFLFPCLVTAYNTGFPTLGRAVRWFSNEYLSTPAFVEELSRMGSSDQHEAFYRFATATYGQGQASGFGPDASDYVLKIWALRELLDAHPLPQDIDPPR